MESLHGAFVSYWVCYTLYGFAWLNIYIVQFNT